MSKKELQKIFTYYSLHFFGLFFFITNVVVIVRDIMNMSFAMQHLFNVFICSISFICFIISTIEISTKKRFIKEDFNKTREKYNPIRERYDNLLDWFDDLSFNEYINLLNTKFDKEFSEFNKEVNRIKNNIGWFMKFNLKKESIYHTLILYIIIFNLINLCEFIENNIGKLEKVKDYMVKTKQEYEEYQKQKYRQRQNQKTHQKTNSSTIDVLSKYLKSFGLTKDTLNEKTLKQQYRKLVKKYHPDNNKSPKTKTQFEEVQKRYDYLKQYI